MTVWLDASRYKKNPCFKKTLCLAPIAFVDNALHCRDFVRPVTVCEWKEINNFSKYIFNRPGVIGYFPFCTYGHTVQLLPHVSILLKFSFGCVGGGGESFDLIKKFHKLFSLLKAFKCCFPKHYFNKLFCVTIGLQCLAITWVQFYREQKQSDFQFFLMINKRAIFLVSF